MVKNIIFAWKEFIVCSESCNRFRLVRFGVVLASDLVYARDSEISVAIIFHVTLPAKKVGFLKYYNSANSLAMVFFSSRAREKKTRRRRGGAMRL